MYETILLGRESTEIGLSFLLHFKVSPGNVVSLAKAAEANVATVIVLEAVVVAVGAASFTSVLEHDAKMKPKTHIDKNIFFPLVIFIPQYTPAPFVGTNFFNQ